MDNSVNSLLCRSESMPDKFVAGEGPSATAGGSVSLLASVLGYATGVVAALRERHAAMPAEAEPVPGGVHFPRTGQEADIVAFGALLYELLTGSKPQRDLSQVAAPRGPRVGPAGVRTAATNLALRCLGAVGTPPDDLQQVLTEIRLYSLLARQNGRRSATVLQPGADNDSVPISGPPHGLAAVDRDRPAEEQSLTAVTKPETQLQRHPEVDAPSHREHSPVHEWFIASDDMAESMPLPGVHCPTCSSSFVHPSRPRTKFEHLLVAAGIRLHRCHRCLYRYFAFLGMVITKKAFYRD